MKRPPVHKMRSGATAPKNCYSSDGRDAPAALRRELAEESPMTTTEITFDKLVYIDRLKSAGVAEPQARAHAEALDQALRDTVATKTDLAAAKQELRDDMRQVRDELHGEIREMRNEIARLDHKIDVLGRDLTIRMGGIAIILFGALASIKFFG
jgi:hypothetical protein